MPPNGPMCINGRCRVTTIDPHAHSEIVDFGAGDVWYFPRGHGHSIQGLGPDGCHFILVFDNGYFSEFGTFSITDWIGHTPPAVLAKNFGVPAATFAAFPKRRSTSSRVRCRRRCRPIPRPVAQIGAAHAPLPSAGAAARDVSRRDVAACVGARVPDLDHHDRRAAGIKPGALRELHWHPNADEWQYYLKGRGAHDRVRLGWPGAHRRFCRGRRRLRAAGLRPLHRERRHRRSRARARVQQRPLRIDLGHRLVRGQPGLLLATNFGVPARPSPTSRRAKPRCRSRGPSRSGRLPFSLSPSLRGEGRGEGQKLALALVAAPHPNPLPTEEWGEGTRPTAPPGRWRRPRRSARSLPKAIVRGRYFMPQSGAGISGPRARTAGPRGCGRPSPPRLDLRDRRSRSTPSTMVLSASSFSTPRSSLGCAASIEICCAMVSASCGRNQ